MKELIDLHTHSTASDGSMKPKDLVRYASDKGLKAIALTDHDTVEGIASAVEEGKKTGFEVIPGVEISADFNGEMHILGFYIDFERPELDNTLEMLKDFREKRNPEIVKKLNKLGMDITMVEVEQEVGGEVTGRVHIARVLKKKGYVKSIDDAFAKLLAAGRPAYTSREKLSPQEAISTITGAGGVAVLAHPVFLGIDYRKLDVLLGELKEMGLKGVEAYYSNHTKNDTGKILRLALKHGLLVTGGSDFHGANKPEIEIGIGKGNLKIEYDLLEKLKRAR